MNCIKCWKTNERTVEGTREITVRVRRDLLDETHHIIRTGWVCDDCYVEESGAATADPDRSVTVNRTKART